MSEKYGGYVICMLVLLAALHLAVTGAVDVRAEHCPAGYGTMSASAVTVVAASVALAGVYVAESDADGFVAPADTYTATGIGVFAVAVVLLAASTAAFAKSDTTRDTTGVTAIAMLLALVALVACARWEMQIANSVPRVVAQKHVDTLYDLLRKWDAFASESDLEYFIVSHTLLGAVRHGGLAPWDDTATVGVMQTDLKALSDKALLRRHGLRAVFNPLTGEVRVFQLKRARFPYIRVVTYEEPHAEAPGVWTSPQLKEAPMADALLHDENGHLRHDYVFGPLRLPGPANGAMVLAQQFGADMHTHVTEPVPHDERRLLLSRQAFMPKRALTDADRNPSLPSK